MTLFLFTLDLARCLGGLSDRILLAVEGAVLLEEWSSNTCPGQSRSLEACEIPSTGIGFARLGVPFSRDFPTKKYRVRLDMSRCDLASNLVTPHCGVWLRSSYTWIFHGSSRLQFQ